MRLRRLTVLLAAGTLAAGLSTGTGVAAVQGTAAGRVPALAPLLLRDGSLRGLRGSGSLAPAGVVAVPRPGSSSELDGVWCTSPASCWAVGQYAPSPLTTLNEVLRWDGRRWRNVVVPSPGGTAEGDISQLYGIRCLAARDCWAVGLYLKGGAELDEALHWDGRKWSRVATPTPGGTLIHDFNELFDVTCISPARCWAVGDYGRSGSGQMGLNQALRWNGRKWSEVTTPDPAGTSPGEFNALQSIRCISATSCLAVGTYGTLDGYKNQALRWNGTKWSRLTTPNPGGTSTGDVNMLVSLTCASPVSCWAAGNYGTDEPSQVSLNELLHWNGRAWSPAAAPDPDGTGSDAHNQLSGVFCSSASNCWAVGDDGTISGGAIRNEVLHWNGTRWSKASAPNPGGTTTGDVSRLFAVRCSTRGDCWAVGSLEKNGGADENQVLHWNGTRWSAR